MPVYLIFPQVTNRGLQLALCGQTCPLCLELAICDRGSGPEESFLSNLFLIVQVSAIYNLLKPSCSKIFIY